MIPMPTKIKCHFKGCSGEIDLMKEMRNLLRWSSNRKNPKLIELSWCIHTIICPKCMNSVGFIEVAPDVWITHEINEEKPKKYSIRNPRNGKKIVVGNDKESLDPYLKKWARMFDRDEDTEETGNGEG